MWTHDPLHQLTCPRCTAVLARTDDACHRCGQAVALAADGARFVAAGAVCPRCSRPVRPGEAYHSATDWSDAGACPHCGSALAAAGRAPQVNDEKAERCAPHALEHLVRAEAVDGWSLWDTTIDPHDPGMLLVHFRRPGQRQGGSHGHAEPRHGQPQAAPAGAPAASRRPSPHADPRARSRPAAAERDPDPTPASGFDRARLRGWAWQRAHGVASAAARPLRSGRPARTGAKAAELVWVAVRAALAVAAYAAVFAVVAGVLVAYAVVRRMGWGAAGLFMLAVFAAAPRRWKGGRRRKRWLKDLRKGKVLRHGVAWPGL